MLKRRETTEQKSFCTPDAAEYLGVSASALEKSKKTGLLLGEKSPPYLRAGRSVRYLRNDLDAWLESLPKYSNSAQEFVSNKNQHAG